MEKIKIEREVPKEVYELAMAMAAMTVAVKKALDDGFQPGSDVPVIITQAIAVLAPAVDGVGKVGEEAKAEPFAFAEAFLIAGEKVFKEI